MNPEIPAKLEKTAEAWRGAAAITGAAFAPLSPDYTRGFVDGTTRAADNLDALAARMRALPAAEGDDIPYEVIGRCAFAYVLETATWPAFLKWMRTQAETTAEADNWLEATPDLHKIRRDWLRHSEDSGIRHMGEL